MCAPHHTTAQHSPPHSHALLRCLSTLTAVNQHFVVAILSSENWRHKALLKYLSHGEDLYSVRHKYTVSKKSALWSNTGGARVQREINTAMHMRSVNGETAERGFKLWLNEQSWSNLCAEIQGPPESPYEGGVFVVKILVPGTYPVIPPRVEFRTHIWHPNVSPESGAIGMNILGKGWSPDMTIRTILMAIKHVLGNPDMATPVDEDVARQYNQKQELFVRTAKHWTHRYAGGPNRIPEFDLKMKTLRQMGMYESLALSILSKKDWDVDKICHNFSTSKPPNKDQA